eukprot:8831101-Pyramimonas_sp.AAC.1
MACRYARVQLTLCMHPWSMGRPTVMDPDAPRPSASTLSAACTHMPMDMAWMGVVQSFPKDAYPERAQRVAKLFSI